MKLLLALDGSACSQAAVDALLRFGAKAGDEVTLLTVLAEPPRGTPPTQVEELVRDRRRLADAELATEAVRLRSAGFTVVADCVFGHPAETVIQRAQEQGAEVILAGSQGRGQAARLLLGSVSHAIVSHASCAVLVARPTEERDAARALRVLVAFDDSAASWSAVRFVAETPWFAGAEVRLVHVDEFPSLYRVDLLRPQEAAAASVSEEMRGALDRAEATLRGGVGEVVQVLRGSGYPYQEVLTAAAEGEVDLIVVGDKGRSAVQRFLMGSVTHRVVNQAACSVLVVRG